MDALIAAGLTKNEITLYRLLLRLSNANTTELAKKSNIHRRSVYDVLMRLIDKGLVSYMVSNNVKVYFPNNPEKLSTILEERKKIVDEEIPELIKTFESNRKKKSTQFFIGQKGIRMILEEQLKEKKEILVLGANSKANDILQYFLPKYSNIRIEEKIPIRIIFTEKIKPQKKEYSEVKYMPKKIQGDTAINIYGDNVALIMWNKEEPFSILIHDEAVAKSFRDYFEYIWNTL